MTTKKTVFRPINLIQNGCINRLQQQIAAQQQLLLQVKAALPEFLALEVKHCVLKNSQLLLFTSSAAWASQLRFYSQAILQATWAPNNVQATSVQIRVIAPSARLEPKFKKASKLSPEKLEFLQGYSNSLQDAQLKASFLKLSRTLKQYCRDKP